MKHATVHLEGLFYWPHHAAWSYLIDGMKVTRGSGYIVDSMHKLNDNQLVLIAFAEACKRMQRLGMSNYDITVYCKNYRIIESLKIPKGKRAKVAATLAQTFPGLSLEKLGQSRYNLASPLAESIISKQIALAEKDERLEEIKQAA